MADLVLAYDIINETAADAIPVQSNFERTESYVNGSVIRTDGATVMTAPLQLFGDPVNANDAVRKGFLDLLMPVGVILPYGGSAVPGGLWALANGADMATTVYPALHAAIGYNFGGAGSTFKLPDLRGRTLMGQSATAPFTTLNAPGGNKDVTAMPRHQHTTPNHTHGVGTLYTGGQSANHQHKNDAWTRSGDGAHGHSATPSGSGEGIPYRSGGAGPEWDIVNPNSYTNVAWGTTTTVASTGSAHQHYVDAWVGTANVDHTHGIAGATAGAAPTTDFAGTAGAETNANLPPYIVINFIVRVS